MPRQNIIAAQILCAFYLAFSIFTSYVVLRNNSSFVGFHVDDSEVTLNVCLGKQFTGGELFFRGTRCDKHVNTGSQSEVWYSF